MKKRLMASLICGILLLCFMVNVSAATAATTDENIEYFSDGSYATITIEDTTGPVTRGTVYNKSANKVYTYQDANGNEQYKITLHGEFSVNSGVSSVCTQATIKVDITNNVWKVLSQSTNKSGNQAVGSAELRRYMLLLPVETVQKTLTLTCDKYGNLT